MLNQKVLRRNHITINAVVASTVFISLLVCTASANADDKAKDWKYAGKGAAKTESKPDSTKQGDSKNNATEDGIKSSATAQTVILGDKLATVNLPPNFIFVEEAKAKEFLKSQGSGGEGVLGIIAPPKNTTEDYFVVCRFEDVGYVNDDDADKLNADEILNSYKEGTAEQNEERKELNLPPIFVGGWAEKPHYDKQSHHVIWGIQIKDEDSDAAPVAGINYNTRILGRRGVLSMNLVTGPETLERDKKNVGVLLAATKFNQGHTYAEYVPGKDKSAGYGIAGLVLGGGAMAAAAKFGVFGALWKWALGLILVLKKFIIVILVGIGGLIAKLFGKKDSNKDVPPRE
jgi:Uncharacterized membrane-anchored protein conserved in bacteria